MKKIVQRVFPALVCSALAIAPLGRAAAEDVDLFVSSATSVTQNPNILIVLDNSANWSAANQHWPNNMKQGESELRAIRTLASELTDKVNVGLMMLTAGSGSNANGGYVRFHVRQMTSTNKAALQELIGDSTCTSSNNSLNGTPNCIFKNFDTPTEKIGTSATDYSRALFEVFKYFGGYTNPANAFSDTAGSPIDTTAGPAATHFGAVRYSGNPDGKDDPGAFVNGSSGSRTTYNTPIDSNNSCAKNYIIVIGNGFPSGDDTNGAILSGVGGTTTQLAMPVYSTTTATRTDTLTLSDNATNCRKQSDCVSALSTAYGTAYTTYACSTTGATFCNGSGQNAQYKNWALTGTGTFTATTATGASQAPTGAKVRYGDEWAKYLYTTDIHSAAGRQFIYTYTIDVFKDQPDGDQNSLLSSMAKYGGGKYFQASSEDAILAALRQIVIEIQSVNSVFASASLPINATNRSQNENQVFIGMFRPDSQARPRWYGNLKRYQIGLFGEDAKLADKFGLEAVSSTTGFVQACATSYWTSDSSTYWSFASSAGTCTTSTYDKFSDAPDGPLVEKGATAEVVRKGNNPTATDTTPTYAVNRSVFTCKDSATCNFSPTAMHDFNATNVSAARLGVSGDPDPAASQTAIVNFALGKDVDAENAVAVTGDSTSTTDVRGSVHGDVAHSRPLPVNYGGSTGVVLFYGSNDGTFRAVRGNDGKELWAFIAPEHHSKLKRLRDNSPIITYPGVSNLISPTPQSKDYFFDGSAGLYQTFNSDNTSNTAWVFPTMRRGGRMVYAFDVSTVTSPKLKWRVGCPNLTNDTDCTSGFEQMGQTWSISNVAFIKGFSTSTPVVVMGGGYDSCEDTDLNNITTNPCTSTKGNRVYVLNAATGARLAALDTDRAVPGDVTLVDRDFDGYVDHAYAADTGGNVYRVDFVDPTSLATRTDAQWTITKIARTNVTTPAGRKFLFGPAALPTSSKVYLSLTSGDRERPLVTNYPYVLQVVNRAYMYIDKFATTGLPVDLDGSTMMNVSSGSTCSTALTSSQDGWFFNLEGGRGEQGVTSSIIFGGLVFFSTNRAQTGSAASCSNNLGEARGYAVNLLNGSGAVGTGALCGGTSRSNTFTGGGLPPSPVTGTVPVGDRQVTVMIGGIDRTGAASSPIGSQKVKPTIAQKRARIYWYKKGDQ